MGSDRHRPLPPDKRDWLERPKHKPADAGIIAFLLGILILAGMIYFALITPSLCEGIVRSLLGSFSAGIPDNSTQFQIAGVTYDTKEIVTDLFNRTF